MQKVTEFPVERAGGKPPGTRLWMTPDGEKELDEADENIFAIFEQRAANGFKGYEGASLRWEADGIWAFGTSGKTTRICGYFPDEARRDNFVICGVWKGKSGKGNSRPPQGDTVVNRAIAVRKEGVDGIPQQEKKTLEGKTSSTQESEGQALLLAWSKRRPS